MINTFPSSATHCRGDNLLFESDGVPARLKVIDYDCARISHSDILSYGEAQGALVWRAPELFTPPSAHPRANTRSSDMWSAGLVLYEIARADGTLAYRQQGRREAVLNWLPDYVLKGATPEQVTPLSDAAHPLVVEVMRKCLVLEPTRRISAADEFTMLRNGMVEQVARDRYLSAKAALAETTSLKRAALEENLRSKVKVCKRRPTLSCLLAALPGTLFDVHCRIPAALLGEPSSVLFFWPWSLALSMP